MKSGIWKKAACARRAVALSGPLVGLAAVGSTGDVGALTPFAEMTVSTTSITFAPTTLGDVAGPISFTLTNTNETGQDTIPAVGGFSITGPGADDYIGVPESDCNVDDAGNITLEPGGAAGSTCTLDNFFNPGALGTRSATLAVNDSASSGVTVNFSGTGSIGYYQVSASGAVAHFGDATFHGDASGLPLNKPIEGIAQTGDNGGYWLVASDGGIFNYGDAGFFGSAGGLPLNKPIVGMASTGTGGGYWLVASDGGIFTYGDALFYGSTGST